MALDPRGLLALAELLAAIGTEEAYRSAINRAYYACHLLARDLLFGLDAVLLGAGSRRPSHLAVIDAVRQRVSPADVYNHLGELKKMREVADYVRGDEHPEVQGLFRYHRVSGWEGLAGDALPLARATFAALEEALPAAP